ncbi:MAG: 1,4-alpha-D-glucan 1-alpha-D-glucosylmutase [Acidimicrobiales bacterium]|nr:1,4-alpha-D-glucan 1-alpha-D-glucosylmutase [Acidimicrobiales bacterium]
MDEPARVAPLVATYRLQLTPTFGLDDAAAIVPYLAELGVSHVYTSSYLRAASGSTHGYDTVDHGHVSDELGGEAALQRFHAALREHGLGNVIDVVPNHMSVAEASENRRWWNVLRDGQDSPDAVFFDIDWSSPDDALRGKVLLPILGEDFDAELAASNIALVRSEHDPHEWEIHYADHRFPVAPGTVTDDSSTANGLSALHDRQHYRLACWRVASRQLNYRRFFDVTTLVGVRVEDPRVFAAAHDRTLDWVAKGDVQGLRIDHPDGLRDPGGYLADLRKAAPDAWIVVEKILEPGEELPSAWPVDGTTGYDPMRRITGVFVDPAAESSLTETFQQFVGTHEDYAAVVTAAKQQVLDEMFGAELNRLVDLARRCLTSEGAASSWTAEEIRSALEALLIAMPVYRTYVVASPDGTTVSAEDTAILDEVIPAASALRPATDPALFDALGRILRADVTDGPADELVARFQQLSGPTMAKGVEDTTFFRFNRLISLNEVGSDPSLFGVSADEFHHESVRTAANHPLTMSATSTHDTKRSEDVRARINLLSEMPDDWRETVNRWQTHNDPQWPSAPNRATEYLLYQTLLGAHPISGDRVREVLRKSMREAKQITSWTAPTEAEDEMFAFAEAIAADPEFMSDLDRFVTGSARAARLAGLSQLVLKAMGPGIPDFYQGSELWTNSLVDPDNRSPVDFAARRALLPGSEDRPDVSLDDDTSGASKLWMTRRLLRIRADHADAFTGPSATYAPLAFAGDGSDRALGFCRGGRVTVVVPVRPLRVVRDGWASATVTLPPGEWRDGLDPAADVLYSGSVRVDEINGSLGLAVLAKQEGGS